MEPEKLIRPVPEPPKGSLLTRSLRAVFLERRLPYRVRLAIDSLCIRLGFPCTTIVADGLKVRVRRQTRDPQFARHVIVEKEYNPPGYEIAPTDTVIDVGGQIGSFAIHAARCAVRGRVLSFEPMTENYRLVCENIRLNGFDNVLAMHRAVLESSGTASLHIASGPRTGSHSVVLSGVGKHTETVSTVSLKDIFDENGIETCEFLKLDCEGAEYAILFTLPKSYLDRIDKIAMEFHVSAVADKRERGDKLVSFLQSSGFQIDKYVDQIGTVQGYIFARRP